MSKISTFWGKESPRPLDWFLKFYGLLYAQLSCISVSNLTWFASQVTELLLSNSGSVKLGWRPCSDSRHVTAPYKLALYYYYYAQLVQFSRAPCRKNYALDRKMIGTFFIVATCFIMKQSLGKMVLRTPDVGAKIVFVCYFIFYLSRSESGAQLVPGVHCLNKHCVAVYGSISMRFPAFFVRISLSDALHSSHFRRQVAPQFSRNLRSKISKTPKIGEKVVCITLYR